jgi:hypothetical protein
MPSLPVNLKKSMYISCKRSALAGMALALTLGTGGVNAADYLLVIPVKGKAIRPSAVRVELRAAVMPGAVVGDSYTGFDFNSVLSVSGDSAYTAQGLTWGLAAGTLPSGLALGADGRLSGVPTTAANAAFTLSASYKGQRTQQDYMLAVAGKVALSSAELPRAVAGEVYDGFDFNNVLAVSGDVSYQPSGVTWGLSGGTVPSGLALSANGRLTGKPDAAAPRTTFTVSASYNGQRGQQAYILVVAPAATKVFDTAGEDGTLTLTAPAGTVFREVVFASYGSPTGTGPNYVAGTCHSEKSVEAVAAAFLNKSTGTIDATNDVFTDPCVGIIKSLAVVLKAY